MSSAPVFFATLDRLPAPDPVEGMGVQHTIEYRDASGLFIERIHGTRESCERDAVQRGVPVSAIRIPARARS